MNPDLGYQEQHTLASVEALGYDPAVKPSDREEMTESQKRWLSWNIVSSERRRATQRFGVKGSYQGTVPEDVIAKRRAKNKVARKQRKVNRQNGSGN